MIILLFKITFMNTFLKYWRSDFFPVIIQLTETTFTILLLLIVDRHESIWCFPYAIYYVELDNVPNFLHN